jgi:ribokinase
MSARIVVVGSLNMDLVIRAAHIPKPGETILGSEFQIIPGGKGANQAVAAARLGSQVSMVGRVGEDSFGDELLHNLEMVGVDGKHIRQDPDAASGVALIVVDDQGENSIVVASGSNMQLTEEDVEAAEGVISGAEVLIMQLEVPLQIVRRAAQIAHDNQVLVILNPAPAMPLPSDLFGMVDLLIPNESETAILTGLPAESQIEMETAASFLLDLGIKTVVKSGRVNGQ